MDKASNERVPVATVSNRAPALHLAWTSFQRRQVSMAELVGFECVFLPMPAGTKGRWNKAWQYAQLFMQTLGLLRRRRPGTIWFQLPQVPLMWAAMLYRLLFDRRVKLVADCHNAMFRPPWSRVPFGLSALRHCDLVLVHNQAVLKAALAMGLPPSRTRVLEDVPPLVVAPAALPAIPAAFAGRPRPWVLFPGSFSADEPVQELLAAARLLGHGVVVMTGRVANAAKHGHDLSKVPANVVMPGFLSLADFEALLVHCDVVLALTKYDGIQLSVCNEALGFGKPMVVSDTSLLREMFASAAVMADSNDAAALAAAVNEACRRKGDLVLSARKLAVDRRDVWVADQFRECNEILGRTGN